MLDLVGVEEGRWERGNTKLKGEYAFFMGRLMAIMK
jgi:hypothetical protein